jgi:hypothetical protein
MGLIDLKTDLKSLRYGKDTIGGGYSGQPYIQEPIPDGFNNLGANEDFILRGGVNVVGDAATDIKRLTKMFTDTKSPNGLLFIAKQNLLSQTAVRTQTTRGVNEGIYSPLNTLAQAGVVNIGGHLNKQGVNPFAETGAYANNIALYSVKVKPTQPVEDNRLARLHQLVSINAGDKLDGFILNNGPANVLTYIGGPGSILGVGKTNIRYSSFRTGNQNPYFSSNPDFFTGKNNQRSVNVEDKQVGGLQIETGDGTKSWIKGGIVFDYKGKFYTDTLPNNNVNSPQSSSLNNTWYSGPSTWTPQYTRDGEFKWGNIDKYSSEYLNNSFFITYLNARKGEDNKLLEVFDLSPFTTNNKLVDEVIPEDQRILGNGGSFIQKTVNAEDEQIGGLQINPDKSWTKSTQYGLPSNNVNTPQSSNLSNIPQGPLTWTAKQDVTNPSGSNYIDASSPQTSTKYNLLTQTGISKLVGDGENNQPLYLESFYRTPKTVYQSSPGTYPLISDPTKVGGETPTLNGGAISYSQKDLDEQESARYTSLLKEDFRKVLRRKITNNTVAEDYLKTGNIVDENYISYTDRNIGVKNLLGNPGTKLKNLSDFTKGTGNILTRDLINAEGIGEDLSNDDLVQFRIQSLFTSGSTLAFRAFLGGITDSYTAGINSQQYPGRGENFYTYSGQTRKLSLSWTIAALSREELLPMYKRLNYLASMTAPKYVDGFMQGPIVSLTVGGYIYNLPGYIEGFSVDIAEDSTWEIAINPDGTKDNTISQLPHVVKVTGFSFTPLPNYLPEAGNAASRFISIVAPNGTSL